MIETERLLFEKVNALDLDDLNSLFSDEILTKYFVSGPDRSLDDTRSRIHRIEEHWNMYGFGDYIIKDKNNLGLIGYGGLHYKSVGGNINISYLVTQSAWGLGYGKEICRALINHGLNSLNLESIFAEIDPDNQSSIKLIEKNNFKYNRTVNWKGFERLEYVITKDSTDLNELYI